MKLSAEIVIDNAFELFALFSKIFFIQFLTPVIITWDHLFWWICEVLLYRMTGKNQKKKKSRS